MLVIDANVIVSVLAGIHSRSVYRSLRERGVVLSATSAQLREAFSVLTKKIHEPVEHARALVNDLARDLRQVELSDYAAYEQPARARLHARAQSDWAVLAAALAYDGGIWSNDRDFFGVGVPVWTTRNVGFAAAA